MKTAKELTKNLSELYEAINDESINLYAAKQMNSAADKLIRLAKLELEYRKARCEHPDLEFFS